MEEKKYSKKAVLSFVLIIICILYILLFFIISFNVPFSYTSNSNNIISYFGRFIFYTPIICLVSIVLGIMGIIEIKKNKNLKGMWLAIPSLILSIFLGVIAILFFMFAIALSALS